MWSNDAVLCSRRALVFPGLAPHMHAIDTVAVLRVPCAMHA